MEQVDIRVREKIDDSWADWFSGLSVSHTRDGGTRLSGLLPDQSALYGLLVKLRDLGLSIAKVVCEQKNDSGTVEAGGSS